MMAGLNDIRVLRNFIGDEYHEEDYNIKKYERKRLNMGRLDKMHIKGGKIFFDSDSKNADVEVVVPEKTEFISGPQGVYAAGPLEQPGSTGMGRGVFLPEGFTPYIKPETEKKTYGKGFGVKMPKQGIYSEGKYIPAETTQPQKTKQDLYSKRQEELNTQQKLLTQRQQEVDQATHKKWQLAQQKKNIEQTRLALSKLKFEQSGMGKFVQAIHNPQLAAWGGRVQENIGQSMGGSIVGSFEEKGATHKLRQAITAKQAYIQWLQRKHQDASLGEAQIRARGTAGERKRLDELDRAIARAQGAIAATGFMGGASGQALVKASSRPQDLTPFTQLGMSGTQIGSFTPEAFSRLGVTQNLTAIRPENKWDALLGRGSGGGKDIDKITQILGKAPNPMGNVESPRDRIRRFM